MEFRNQKSRGSGGSSRSNRDTEESGVRDRKYPTSSQSSGSSGGSKHYRDEGGARGGGARSKRRPDSDVSTTFRSGRSGLDKRSDESVKEYESKRSSESKQLSDDPRLSSILRRLTREEDYEKRLAVATQLKEFILQSENQTTLLKSTEGLLSVMWDTLQERGMRGVKEETAASLGILGYIMASESDRYFHWFFPKLTSTHSEDCRMLLLLALLETLKRDLDGNSTLRQYMPMIMSKCQIMLESADAPNLLIAVVNVIKVVVKLMPACFESHFRDTVDILVGWHIDTTQKESVIEFSSDALIGLRQFWITDLSFSMNLLTQFLEDTEAYVEDLVLVVVSLRTDADLLPPEKSIVKITALIKVFTTVVKCLYDDSNVDNQYLTEILERLVQCVDVIFINWFNEKALTAANACLTSLLTKIGSDCLGVEASLLQLIARQAFSKQEFTYPYLLSLLGLVNKTIEVVNTSLPPEFLGRLMDVDSLVPALCFAHNKQILHSTLAVYKSVMGLKSVPLLQEGYRLVLSHLEVAYNSLLAAVSDSNDTRCHLVTSNPVPFTTYKGSDAETVTIFSICVLAEIGNAKSNLFGMWALDPSIFQLLSARLLPLCADIMTHHAPVHYALLQALYSHCSR